MGKFIQKVRFTGKASGLDGVIIPEFGYVRKGTRLTVLRDMAASMLAPRHLGELDEDGQPMTEADWAAVGDPEEVEDDDWATQYLDQRGKLWAQANPQPPEEEPPTSRSRTTAATITGDARPTARQHDEVEGTAETPKVSDEGGR